ncbi:MarR family winged helix-turn-helix transcriptional regulator [Nesterenkonia haasae]|uniref:MarR family winged helix-turn-helix transcriptional regulator n=1 Tax=Nesterenkonia haasae TaxID=2587813 RepID=UPI0013910AFF|nr:MarR family transcriptional regulator [Nesterenkonia haasae]NDK31810.1 MarR family transcriptional regulator [Nesterenkonia haasae]
MTDHTEAPGPTVDPDDSERIDALSLEVWTNFLEAHTRLMRLLERDLKSWHGITLAEYDVLHRLEQAADTPLRMSTLAQALLYTTGGLTRLIDRMQDRDLIERTASASDRRVTYVVLTSKGRATLRQVAGTHLRGLQRHFGRHLKAEEAEAVSAFMHRLAHIGQP